MMYQNTNHGSKINNYFKYINKYITDATKLKINIKDKTFNAIFDINNNEIITYTSNNYQLAQQSTQ